jgi:chromosomal replication initiation ATPase DnaA
MRQLVLDFPHRAAVQRSDFLVSDCNREAVGWIDRWPAWPAPVLILHGPPQCGKTHLAGLWRERASAAAVAGPVLDEASLTCLRAGAGGRIAIDDADHAPEATLLHLYNSCSEGGGSLLLTAGRPPGSWEIGLADLRSRLRAAPAVGIGMPDDALLGAVLVKHFADRQLRVGPGLIAYLVGRIERSFAAAAAIVAALDTAAFPGHEPIRIPLARRVLRVLGDQSPPASDFTVT